VKADDAVGASTSDDCVVDRQMCPHVFAVPSVFNVQGDPFLNPELATEDSIPTRRHLVRTELGQEPDPAKVDADDRYPEGRRGACTTDQRAVTPETENNVRLW
jgi:hypothetical protein